MTACFLCIDPAVLGPLSSCTIRHGVVAGWLGCHADLDHTNEELRLSIIDWMSWLKTEIGYHGWRFDFTKVFPALQRGGPAACRLCPGAVAQGRLAGRQAEAANVVRNK